RDPLAALERAHEDLLRGAGALLERGPRDLDVAGDDRAAGDVDHARVLVRVDRVRRVVVDLRAAAGQRGEGREGRARHGERGGGGGGRGAAAQPGPHEPALEGVPYMNGCPFRFGARPAESSGRTLGSKGKDTGLPGPIPRGRKSREPRGGACRPG